MNLKHLTDNQLLKDTKTCVANELHSTTAVLYHIKEIENRKLFSDLKYSSMLEYAVKELKYSDASAMRRIQAARVLKELPCIGELISSGRLTLSNISLAATYFRKEKIKDSEIKLFILSRFENKTTRECESILFEMTPHPLPAERIQKVSDGFVQLRINVKDETLKKLEDVKALLGHHVIDDVYFSEIADEAKENVFRKRFKLTDKGRVTHSEQGKNPSNHERRTAFMELEEKVCVNCGGLFYAQLDHSESKAHGGSNDPSNLRLLCFHCNQRARIKAKL